MGRSIFTFALVTSFLAMAVLVVLDLNDIHLDRMDLLHVLFIWIVVNLFYIVIKIITHD